MASKRNKAKPLKANPKRQAVPAVRGYGFQFWHTVHAWLELQDEDTLFVEGAEDFDVISGEEATAVQMKDTSRKVTLRSEDIVDAIQNFWELRNKNSERRVFFRFLTRSEIGVEQGSPFGIKVAGLQFWNEAKRTVELVARLRDFLVEEKKFSSELITFLTTATPQEIREQLMIPIEWETGTRGAESVEEAIRRKLILHGDKVGVGPSESSRVISRLLKEVFGAGGRSANRSLDRAFFLEIFEEETSERIPKQQLAVMRKLLGGSSLQVFPAGTGTTMAQFQITPIETNIPPTAPDVAPRLDAVNAVTRILTETGIVILVGSTGVGKTTLAKLVARAQVGPWCWVNFAGYESHQYTYVLRYLAEFLDRNPKANSVVLDDLSLSPQHTRGSEDYLAGLLYTILQRNGRLILTGSKQIPERLSRRVGLQHASNYVVPALTKEEIRDLAMRLGCSSIESAKFWAAITLVHTSGHVQLAHAQLKDLARRGWPNPSTDDVIKRPPTIEKELSDSQMLLQALPESHRELLYRLSIVAGLFRRDHAVTIGELEPSLPSAGEICDQLVGPWIEHVGTEYMRVSPLLKGCGNRVWSAEKLKEWYEATGFAILRPTPRTQSEASTALLHGILSGSGRLTNVVVNSLLTGREELIKAAAAELSWLKVFIKRGAPIFESNKSANFMLRLLQFRVVSVLEPGTTALKALEVWDADPLPDSPPEFVVHSRALYLATLIFEINVPIPARKVIRAIAEMADIIGKSPEMKTAFERSFAVQDSFKGTKFRDPIGVALIITLARPTSVQMLSELLDALEQDVPDDTRRRMLAALPADEPMVRMFIDAVWFEESKSRSPDWVGCIQLFERCITLARLWKVAELAACAARAIAIIRDEYMDDKRGALTVLRENAPSGEVVSITIENERAVVLSHMGENEAAVKCWDRILPLWQNPPVTEDVAVLYALNHAGIAAARNGDWKKAAAFFCDGAVRAGLLAKNVWECGFQVDGAWALWKAGDYYESFYLLCKALKQCERLRVQGSAQNHAAKVQRVFGHVIVCIKRGVEREDYGEATEPRPGLASNPDASEDWKASPLELCLGFLAEIEAYLRLEPVLFEEALARYADSRIPMVQSVAADLKIRYAFRDQRFNGLPQMGCELEVSAIVSKRQRDSGHSTLEKVDEQDVGKIEKSRSIMPTLLTHALIASATSDIPAPYLIENWQESASELQMYDWINDWLAFSKRVFTALASEVVDIMGDEKLTTDMRLLAAARVMKDADCGVDRMVNAQCWIVGWLSTDKMFWNYDVGSQLAVALANVWKKQSECKAVLRNPRLTVPEILRECESNAVGIAKAAKIVLAATKAVGLKVGNDLIKQLEAAAASTLVNPYRFSKNDH